MLVLPLPLTSGMRIYSKSTYSILPSQEHFSDCSNNCRLFDKEAEDWKSNGTPKPTRTTTFFSGADSPPDFSVQLDASDRSTISGDLTGNLFQIPDLSSVQHRNRCVLLLVCTRFSVGHGRTYRFMPRVLMACLVLSLLFQ